MLKVEREGEKIAISAEGKILDLSRELVGLVAWLELEIGDKINVMGLLNDKELIEKEKISLREGMKNATD